MASWPGAAGHDLHSISSTVLYKRRYVTIVLANIVEKVFSTIFGIGIKNYSIN